MRKLLRSSLVSAFVLSCGSAYALTATTTFQSKIIITAQCLVTANTLDFGTTGVLAANVDVTTTLAVTCTNTTAYNIGLDGGQAASVTARKMKGGPSNELIAYSIFSNSGRTTNWGNTVGTDTVASAGTGVAQSFTLYGRVIPQTTPTPGTYTDTVTVTVTY